MKHVISMPTEGILVVPMWPIAVFWNKITKDGSHLLPMFYKHHVFKLAINRGQDCSNMFNSGLMEYMTELKNYCIDTQCVSCTSAQ